MAIFSRQKRGQGYLSIREINQISRENRRAINRLEKQRSRKRVLPEAYTTQMRNPENIAEIDDLHTNFYTDIGTIKAVNGVTFDIPKGKTVAIVGESGCGKSVLGLSLMQLLQHPQGQIVDGSIRFNMGDVAYDLAKAPAEEMQRLRGNQLAMIFQEPMASLNPVFRVGAQIDEAIGFHNLRMTSAQVKQRTLELLELVEIANGEDVYRMYPHELSGGMRQRILIAMALSCSPRLIIADEPTTALDVTIQAQILDLLRNLKTKINASILLITHDLGVVAEMADFVAVMYAGRVVEKGTAEDVLLHPAHPYTVGLMAARPVMGRGGERLYSIPGSVPNPVDLPNCCYFRDRCERRFAACAGQYPREEQLSHTHFVSCYSCAEREAEA